MRIIGLDLAITSAHKALVMDEKGQFLTPVFAVMSWPEELAGLLRRAREGVPEDCPLVVVMEPTGAGLAAGGGLPDPARGHGVPGKQPASLRLAPVL